MRSNTELEPTEFVIVQQLKRAVVEMHNANYDGAEKAISNALEFIYKINKS